MMGLPARSSSSGFGGPLFSVLLPPFNEAGVQEEVPIDATKISALIIISWLFLIVINLSSRLKERSME